MNVQEMIKNPPAKGLRFFMVKDNEYGEWLAAVSDEAEYFVESGKWKQVPARDSVEYFTSRPEKWVEVFPTPERVMTAEAELLANLPADGVRVFRGRESGNLYAVNDEVEFDAAPGSDWHKRNGTSGVQYFADLPYMEDITPTLPDPSGDLPDGTRVRIVFEGPVKNWKRGRGSLETSGRGQLYFGLRDTDGATVEVLALPTPPPSALDGKPGSLWRDPETGTTWVRIVDSESGFTFAQVGGEVTRRGLLAQILEEDAAMTSRLVHSRGEQ